MSTTHREEEQSKAIRDIFRVMHDSKMFINEKRYLTETIVHLYELGYYEKLDTIFGNGRIKKED